MKRLTFTGTDKQNLYQWFQSGDDYGNWITTGTMIDVPMKVTLTWDEEARTLSFSFTAYECITTDNPEAHKKVWKGKLTSVDLVISESKDNSGGMWKRLAWIGKYHSYAAKTEEFCLDQSQYGDYMTYARGEWAHKRFDYPRCPTAWGVQSSIMYMDDKSQAVLEELWAITRRE